jgi:hypothetical protein
MLLWSKHGQIGTNAPGLVPIDVKAVSEANRREQARLAWMPGVRFRYCGLKEGALFAADAVGLQSTAELWWQSSQKRLELRCRPCLRLRRGFASPNRFAGTDWATPISIQFRIGPVRRLGGCGSNIMDLKIEILLRNLRFVLLHREQRSHRFHPVPQIL